MMRNIPVIPGRTTRLTPMGTEIDLADLMVQSDETIAGGRCAACGSAASHTNRLTWGMVSAWRMVLCADFRACNSRTDPDLIR